MYTISLSPDGSAVSSTTYIGDMGHANFCGLAVDDNGVLYAGRGNPSDGEEIYTVNTSTGATSLPTGIYGVASAPEPAVLVLVLLGSLALLRRQRGGSGPSS